MAHDPPTTDPYLPKHPPTHPHATPDRYGFDYLVLPVMEQGGFRVFAEMLAEGRDSPPRAEDNGGLALGRYVDVCVLCLRVCVGARLFLVVPFYRLCIHPSSDPSSSCLHNHADPKIKTTHSALEEKLSTLSETISADPPAATTTSDGPLSSSAPGVTRPGPVQDDPAALDPSAWRKGKPASGTAAVAARREPVDWSLSNSMKLYMALAALTLAVGFGKGTGGAIDRGVLTPETLESVRLAAAGAVVANLLSAPLSLLLLLQAGRPFAAALPMALKALMAGPAAVVEYRLTGQFERRDGAADGSGGGGIVGK